MNESETILEMLGGQQREARTLAVIGLSDDPSKPSYAVSAYMREHGYKIYPVNPVIESVLGEKSYRCLADLPVKPDVVNVFRRASYLPKVVDEMLPLGLKNLWAQMGIWNPEAAARAEAAGIRVVMDRCIMVEHRRLFG